MLRLPADIEQHLDVLAKKTGRSKSYYALEDYYLARRRTQRRGSRVTLENLERDLAKRSKR
jgi:RHH-type rel operon transcriptional repressor/antitoxin RelB